MSHTFPFIVLRANPDPLRGESLNVGVVAWVQPDQPVVRVDLNPRRLAVVHPDLARVDLTGWAESLQAELGKLNGVEAQRALLPLLARPFSADPTSGTLVAIQGREQDAIDQMFARLISPTVPTIAKPRARRHTRLQQEIKTWLRRAKLYSSHMDDLSRGRVVSDYPVDPAIDLYSDFALMNGSIHVIETLDLRGIDHLTAGQRGEAALKGMTLIEARDKPNTGKRVAVYVASDEAIVKPAISLIGKNADWVWDMSAPADNTAFADFIASALHIDTLAGLQLAQAT